MRTNTTRHAVGAMLLTAALTLLTGCASTKKAGKGGDGTTAATAAFSAPAYFETVRKNQSEEKNLTAKIKFKAQMDGKSVSTSGTLRMRKDDVVQISLVDPIVGIAEVGRMEFTKDRVLIIDRFNKQYIEVPYEEASFLQRANIDFNTLQSLFWNEIFQPGQAEPSASAFHYTDDNGGSAQTTGVVKIDYTDRLLRYQFRTLQPTGTLSQTQITSTANNNGQFAFDYYDFDKFEGKQFPREMVMTFMMGEKQASLTLTLSAIRNNSDWPTRTQAPSKYTKADLEKIMRALIK